MIDAHVHAMRGNPWPLVERLEALDTRHFNVLGVPALWGADNNLVCLHYKNLLPGRVWAFGGLHWDGQTCPSPETQLELMLQAGFDGLKLLETKPTMQKELGFLPDAPEYEALFALAEEKQVPIIWHVGDPAPFWHLDQVPAFAVENGWTYEGEGFLPLQELYRRTELVLARHPRLRVVLAHLYFCSDDRAHLERLFERYPNLHIDLTPGSEMYLAFREDREGWQAFFRRYPERILLGSDTTNGEEAFWSQLGSLPRDLLKPRRFSIFDQEMDGFALEPAAVNAIASGNFKRLAGDSPKAINREALGALARFYAARLPRADAELIQKTMEEFFP